VDNKVIEGVLITALKKIHNPKGNLFHVIKKSDAGYNGFGEAYISTVMRNEIKGWKKHQEMTLNLIVPNGKIRIIVFDERDDSVTLGKFHEIILSVDSYYRVTVPPRLWVAFQGISDGTNMLLNIANIEHDPDEAVSIELDKINYPWFVND
jgi:dTDP-4-dehydrorhamnose 3,5-epimerase